MNVSPEHTLERLGIVNKEAQQLFLQKASITELPKNAPVFVEDKPNGKEYIILEGVAHRYNISAKGDIVTTAFYQGESVVTPHFARTSSAGKSIFSLAALTPLVFIEIPVKDLDYLRYNNSEFREFGQRVIEKELAMAVQMDVNFRSLTAAERLIAMRAQYPNLENEVPLQVISSYLGITNVSFSRLRNELMKRS